MPRWQASIARLFAGQAATGGPWSRQAAVLSIALVLLVLPSSTVQQRPNADTHCTVLGRRILTAPSGNITDGEGNYPDSAHCEWLIVGKRRCLIELLNAPFGGSRGGCPRRMAWVPSPGGDGL